VVGSQVSIIDNAFQPTTIAADADDTVNWTNNGSLSHTVTFDNGKDCGTLASSDMLTVLFLSPGTYAYHCNIHPSMRATVTVS
jgi:plastocyanin